MIALGKYRHYKGGEYEVIGTAYDKKNEDVVVVYKSTKYGTMYTRSIDDFTSDVKNEVSGTVAPKFLYLGE